MTARKLYVVEGCPVVEGCTHTIDLTGRKPTRPKGIEFADILQSILTAPFDAERLSRETLEQAVRETA